MRIDKEQRDPVVKPEHMPEAHRKYLGYNAEEFTEWAHAIGPKTTETVQYFLTSGKEAEQGFKACASLTKLGNRYGAERLEDACERVLRLTSAPTLRNIRAIPHNSARADPEKIWVLIKALFRRCTLCTSRKSDEIRAQIFQEMPKADCAVLP